MSLAVYWWAMLVVHWRALNTVGMTLYAVLTFHCVFRVAETNIYTPWNEGLVSALVDCVRLMLPSCQTDFMDIHQFYFWLPGCTVWRAEEGSNAFIHLVMHRHPDSRMHTDFFFPYALELSISRSFHLSFSLSDSTLAEKSNALWTMHALAWHLLYFFGNAVTQNSVHSWENCSY